MNWLKQPSTWRGLFLIAGLFGIHLRPELQDAITTAIIAALALIEVIRNEHAPTPVKIELPPISLIGQAGISDADRVDAVRRVAAERMHRQPVQSQSETEPAQSDNSWNGLPMPTTRLARC